MRCRDCHRRTDCQSTMTATPLPDASPAPHPSLGTIIVLAIASLLVVLSLMVVVPPYSLTLFRLGVGAIEYSPILVLLDLLWCLPVNRLLRPRRTLRITTIALLIASACVAVRPLTQFTRASATASAQLGTEASQSRFSLVAVVSGLPTNPAVRERTIPYVAPDGERLTLRLYALAPRQSRPTVVILYGGAWSGGAPTQCENVSRAVASRGYTVAAIDYRHAPASRFPAQIDDVNHALMMLRDSSESWGIDHRRMAILGRSSGGHLAELAAFAPNDFGLKAVIALYAPFDLSAGYVDLPSPDPLDVRLALRSFLGGTPTQQPRRYRAASPSELIRPGLPPTLLLFGGRDHIVKPVFNRQATTALRAARVPVISVELPWAEHGFDMVPTGLGAQLAFNVIVEFLDRELKPAMVAVAP